MLGLSAGTVITKETMEPNNRVLLKGFIVWLYYCFFCYTLSVPRYQRKQNPEPDPGHSSKMTPSCKWPLCVVFVSPRKKRPLDLRMTSSTRFDFKFFRVFSKYRLPGKLHFTIKS